MILMKLSMAHLVDSSVWIAAYLQNDPNHEKCKRLLIRIDDKILLPYCVLSEVATVLTYKHSKKQALEFIRVVTSSNNIEFIDDDMHKELAFFKTLPQRISFTDAALLLIAKERKAKLLTMDKQLVNIYKNSSKIV